MKLTVVLAVLSRNLVLACSSVAPAPVEPTPNIDAIVEAKSKEASISLPTNIAYPMYTSVPTTTPIPTYLPTSFTNESTLSDIVKCRCESQVNPTITAVAGLEAGHYIDRTHVPAVPSPFSTSIIMMASRLTKR